MVPHGPVACTRCWNDIDGSVRECGPFRVVRDPGHWGATNPHTLVLGISKGNTQSNAFTKDPFDTVAFKGIRSRILEVFQSVGHLVGEKPHEFERRFRKEEQDFAFASVVRCSITGFNAAKNAYTSDSPLVLPAFKKGSSGAMFVENCVDQHLSVLPSRTKRVLLLGNTGSYIRAMSDVISRVRGPVTMINAVSYDSEGVRFVHLAHPSRGNGHFGAFIRGEGTPGEKRNLAREALQ